MSQEKAAPKLTEESFKALVNAANAGDDGALRELRTVLDETPELWQRIGDLGRVAEALTIALIAGENRLLEEATKRKTAELRAELSAGTNRIDRLAVDRVVISWLAMQLVDRRVLEAEAGIPAANYWSKRQLQTAKLYHDAVKSLAMVRKLGPILHAADGTPRGLRLAPGTEALATGTG